VEDLVHSSCDLVLQGLIEVRVITTRKVRLRESSAHRGALG
jgi:hypothetical protein